jgi:hypothetical protein
MALVVLVVVKMRWLGLRGSPASQQKRRATRVKHIINKRLERWQNLDSPRSSFGSQRRSLNSVDSASSKAASSAALLRQAR